MNNMRRGFTMIELIFVIVIIGILAAVAIPKLSATRDDAKVSKEVTNLRTCISDTGASFTARGVENNNTQACHSLQKGNCFSVSMGSSTTDGNVTATNITTNSEAWCVAAHTIAVDRNFSNASGYIHEFGGSHVLFD